MLQDRNGTIWFGSGYPAMEGIIRYDGKSLEQFKPKKEGWIRNIINGKNGDILFATRNSGVCRYNGKGFSNTTQPNEMVNSYMMDCLIDKKGNTWFISDYGDQLNDTIGGVWRYDGKFFVKYSTKDGLKNNAVFLIMEDSAGKIWVGTRNTGLYRFNGKSFDSFSE